jgi:hypothetical protein
MTGTAARLVDESVAIDAGRCRDRDEVATASLSFDDGAPSGVLSRATGASKLDVALGALLLDALNTPG